MVTIRSRNPPQNKCHVSPFRPPFPDHSHLGDVFWALNKGGLSQCLWSLNTKKPREVCSAEEKGSQPLNIIWGQGSERREWDQANCDSGGDNMGEWELSLYKTFLIDFFAFLLFLGCFHSVRQSRELWLCCLLNQVSSPTAFNIHQHSLETQRQTSHPQDLSWVIFELHRFKDVNEWGLWLKKFLTASFGRPFNCQG